MSVSIYTSGMLMLTFVVIIRMLGITGWSVDKKTGVPKVAFWDEEAPIASQSVGKSIYKKVLHPKNTYGNVKHVLKKEV